MSLTVDWIWNGKAEEPFKYLDELYRYAFSRTGNREDAEDIAIEVVQALPALCRRKDLKLYMFGMARRKVANRARRHRLTVAESQVEQSVGFTARIDEAAMVHMTLHAISAEHREVLTLKYVSGFTSAEIGRLLGKNPSAIDSLLQRARAAFGAAWDSSSDKENS